MRRAWFALVGFAVLATASSGLMQVWTIPIITANTGDFQMFDLRRQGYDLGQAVTCLARMGPDGVSTYLGAQRVLDTLFPIGLTGVLTLGIYLACGARLGVPPSLVPCCRWATSMSTCWKTRLSPGC